MGARSLPRWGFWTPVLPASESLRWQSPRREKVFVFLSTSVRYKVRSSPLACGRFPAFFKALPLGMHPKCFQM